MKSILIAFWGVILWTPLSLLAQSPDKNESGAISLGARSTISLFNNGHFNDTGSGVGGQFRIRASNRINTEWYLDYISTKIANQATRSDYHIGWSVFYYPFKQLYSSAKTFQPFIEAGHCFDYTRVQKNAGNENLKRWSSAAQAGLGSHFNLNNRFDFTLKSQYMVHLGSDIHTHIEEGVLEIEEHSGTDLEGHILITLSVNYKIYDLW